MDKINFYYDMKALHNIPKEVKDKYFEIITKVRNSNYLPDGGQRVLLVLPTRETANKEFKKILVETNYTRINNNEVKCIVSNNQYCFVDLDTIIFTNFLHGKTFADIRFLG